MATMWYPLAFAIVGLLLYALAKSKLSTIGLVTFAVGLFWLVSELAHRTLHL